MKQIYIIQALFCLVLSSSSLNCLNAQNVGIGTNTPQERLDVTGAVKIGTDTNDSTLAPIGGAGTIRFKNGVFQGWDGTSWTLFSGRGYSPFILNNGLVQPDTSVVNLYTDDFLFGSTSTEEQVDSGLDSRFFFDKSKGAFRVGLVTGDQWNDFKRGNQSFAVGYDVTASGDYSMTLGEKSRATGIGAIALGRKSYAYGNYSFAWGNHSQAIGEGALSFGHRSFATADFSYASGSEVHADGQYSVAFGANAYARANTSFALGYEVIASGDGSFVIGSRSTASGAKSIAAGYNNSASGFRSIALGHDNSSTGEDAIALGHGLTSRGSYSVVFGHNNTALSAYEHVFGHYNTLYTPTDTANWYLTDRLFTVGNGTSALNRSDAFTILKNGYIGIGTSLPSATLHVNGTMRFNDGNQTLGYVLTSDSLGNANWQAPVVNADNQNLTAATLNGASLQIDIEDGNSVTVDLSGLVDDADADTTNELQNLTAATLTGNSLKIDIENGNSVTVDLSGLVDDADADYTNELQNLTAATLTGNSLQIDIDNGNSVTVDLSSLVDDADADASNELQDLTSTASGTNRTIGISNGIGTTFSVADDDNDSSNEIQALSLTGNTLAISGSNNVDLSGFLNTDDQNLTGATLTGNSLQIDIEDGNSVTVDLSGLVDDADADSTNELQNLTAATLTGNSLQIDIENGNSVTVDLSSLVDDADADASNELQDLTSTATGTNRTIGISNGIGTTFSVADDDNDSSNEIQALSLTGNTLAISGSNNVDLSGFLNSDDQNLTGATLTGNSLQIDIEDGNSVTVDLSGLVDDADADASNEFNTGIGLVGTVLQVADGGGTLSVDLASLVEDSDWTVSGNDIYNNNSGNVGIGTAAPDTRLHVSARETGDSTGIKLTQAGFNSLIYHNAEGDLVIQKRIIPNQLVLDGTRGVGIGTDTVNAMLHVAGDVIIADGTESNGHVLTSDANGKATWEDPGSRVAEYTDFINDSYAGNATSGFIDISANTTSLAIRPGDKVVVSVNLLANINSGSGADELIFRIVMVGANGCGNQNGYIFIPTHLNDLRNEYIPIVFNDVFTPGCSGNVTFKIQANTANIDDNFDIDDIQLIAVRY